MTKTRRVLALMLLLLLYTAAAGWAMEITVARHGQKWSYAVRNGHSTAQLYVVQIENKTGVPLKVETPAGWQVENNDGHNVMLAALKNRDSWIRPGETMEFAVYSNAKGVAEEPCLLQGTENVVTIGLVAVPSN